MRFSKEEKLKIYQLKESGVSYSEIQNLYGIKNDQLTYLIAVIRKHSVEWLNRPYRKWTKEEKLVAINRVLINGESQRSVAIDYGLSSVGMLNNWIHDYKKNGYNVVEKPRGKSRESTVNQKKKKSNNNLSKEQKRIKELEEELLYVKAENAYLKGLRDLTIQENKKRK